MHLFYQPEIPNGIHTLPAEESRHAVKVLRLRAGDVLEITDGKGALYEARISTPDSSKCGFTIVQTKTSPPRPFRIHLAVAPTKNTDRIEWLVEKATEIGVDEISLIECKNSERRSMKTERLEKLAVSAMKQSRQVWLPKINPMAPLKSIAFDKAAQKFIAYVDTSNPLSLKDAARKGSSYCALIGPEGDFDLEELRMALDHGFQKVSLGPNRLRTETAALVACLTLNLIQ